MSKRARTSVPFRWDFKRYSSTGSPPYVGVNAPNTESFSPRWRSGRTGRGALDRHARGFAPLGRRKHCPADDIPSSGGNLRAFFGKAVGPETDHLRGPTTGDGRSAQVIRDWKASAFLRPLGRMEARSGAPGLLSGGADQRRAGRTHGPQEDHRSPPGRGQRTIIALYYTLYPPLDSPVFGPGRYPAPSPSFPTR